MEGIVATSYSQGDKFYIDPAKLLPLARFLPQPKYDSLSCVPIVMRHYGPCIKEHGWLHMPYYLWFLFLKVIINRNGGDEDLFSCDSWFWCHKFILMRQLVVVLEQQDYNSVLWSSLANRGSNKLITLALPLVTRPTTLVLLTDFPWVSWIFFNTYFSIIVCFLSLLVFFRCFSSFSLCSHCYVVQPCFHLSLGIVTSFICTMSV